MLHVLIGYAQDLDVRTGWGVIAGDSEFFVTTKRLHNQIHGEWAGGPISGAEAGHYARMLAANAVELLERIQPGDLVLLHDPQTAGLAAPLVSAGARVAWRCHIGVDWENDATRAAWNFLRPHLAAAAEIRLLAARVRAVMDTGRERGHHPAVDRSVLTEEPVPG